MAAAEVPVPTRVSAIEKGEVPPAAVQVLKEGYPDGQTLSGKKQLGMRRTVPADESATVLGKRGGHEQEMEPGAGVTDEGEATDQKKKIKGIGAAEGNAKPDGDCG